LVTVSWSGVPAQSVGPNDWIGFYCPVDAASNNYVDWLSASQAAPGTYMDGHGEVSLMVTDTRSACNFRYFQEKNFSEYVLVATSGAMSFAQGQPMHGHLALTGDPTEMHLSFVSNTQTPLAEVLYGDSPDNLSRRAIAKSTTYAASDMCGPPANTTVSGGGAFIPPGWLHAAVMSDLSPGRRYWYRFGHGLDTNASSSPVLSFRASRPTPDPDAAFAFVVYADMGISSNDAAMATAAEALRQVSSPFPDRLGGGDAAELIIHAGDISYARGAAYIWDRWFQLIEPMATRVPYMISIGNHEYDHTGTGGADPSGAGGTGWHPSWGNMGDDSNGECGVPMAKRFTMPGSGSSNGIFWYSFKYGSMHVTTISTEHDLSPGSHQYQWLEADLKSVNRSQTPWLIVQGHRPMYNSEVYPSDFRNSQNFQRLFEPLLIKYRVNVAFFGHYHSYERTCPVAHGNCTKGAPVHITIGSAGAALDNVPLYGFAWSEFFDDDWGVGRVSIANSSCMKWQYVRNNPEQYVRDESWICQ